MYLFTGMPFPLSVSGAAAALTVVGTELFIRNATTPDKCKIWGYLKDAQGKPLRDVPVKITRHGPIVTAGGDGIGDSQMQKSTNRQGFFEVELVRGVSVVINIQNLGWKKTFTVPDQASIDFFTIT